MIIQTLHEMETIVENNDSLIWNNYDVCHLVEDKHGDLNSCGVYIDGSWYIRTVYPIQRTGWEIPDKFIK